MRGRGEEGKRGRGDGETGRGEEENLYFPFHHSGSLLVEE